MTSTFDDVLRSLGVTEDTLTETEKWSLRELGYVTFPDAIPPDQLKALQDAYDHPTPFSIRPDDPMNNEDGGGRHTNLEYKSPVFDCAWTHPKHLAAVYEILRVPFELFTINGRDPQAGYGHQRLHRDAGNKPTPAPIAVQSVWMLDDFTPDNGATRVVPATHFLDDRFIPLPKDIQGPHPGQLLLTGKAGTIAVFSSHLMHGGTTNVSGKRRRTLHSTFVPHTFERKWQHRDFITPEMKARLKPGAKFLLNVD